MRVPQIESETGDLTSPLTAARGGIGTPEDLKEHLRKFEQCGVDQVTFIQQAGMNEHRHICESLEIFAAEVMPEFKEREAEREARKLAELAPYLEAAMERKVKMAMPADEDLPTFEALGRRITEEDAQRPSIYERPAAG